MAAINIGSTRVRMFSSAGGAGPRRLALIGGAAVVVLGVVGVVVMRVITSARHRTVLPFRT